MSSSAGLKNKQNTSGRNYAEPTACIVTCVIFAGMLIFGRRGLSGDWLSYYNLSIIREPGYALLVRFFLGLAGEETGLFCIAAFQNALAAFSVVLFSRWFYENVWESLWGILISTVLLLIPHLLIPLSSSTHLILTNTVMSEGISLSLFYLYMLQLCRVIGTACGSGGHRRHEELNDEVNTGSENRTGIAAAYAMAVIMCQVRGQMMAAIILTALVHFAISRGSLTVVLRKVIACAVLVFLINSVTGSAYQYAVNGEYTGKALGQTNMLTAVLYVSEPGDEQALGNEKTGNIAGDVLEMLHNEGRSYSTSGRGIIATAKNFENSRDHIMYDIYESKVRDHLVEEGLVEPGDNTRFRLMEDAVSSELLKALLPARIKEWIFTYISVVTVGFIRTVAILHPVLNLYSLLVYAVAVLSCIYLLGKRGMGCFPAVFMATVLLSIAGIVCSTGIMINCLSRFVFYNMPFFYLGLLLAARELIKMRAKKSS